MWLLLFIPILIVVVLVLSLGAVLGAVFWVLGAAWPLLLIGLGVWLFWHEDGRHARRERWARGPRPVKLRPSADERQKMAQPPKDGRSGANADRRQLRQPELPIDVQVKVEQIRRKVDVLLSYADRFPPFSQDLYLVRQTASDYLPRTINAYLALAKQTAAADKPLVAGGKTPYQELKAQLDLLDSKLDDIAQDLQRQDTDRLLANRRFLEDRFGSRDGGKPVLDPRPGATGVA